MFSVSSPPDPNESKNNTAPPAMPRPPAFSPFPPVSVSPETLKVDAPLSSPNQKIPVVLFPLTVSSAAPGPRMSTESVTRNSPAVNAIEPLDASPANSIDVWAWIGIGVKDRLAKTARYIARRIDEPVVGVGYHKRGQHPAAFEALEEPCPADPRPQAFP